MLGVGFGIKEKKNGNKRKVWEVGLHTRNGWEKSRGRRAWFWKHQRSGWPIYPKLSSLCNKQSYDSYLCTIYFPHAYNPICNNRLITQNKLNLNVGDGIGLDMERYGLYGWVLPVWVHQCQLLKISISMPLHELPFFIESSFKTFFTFSTTRSTRNGVRYSNILTP